MIKLVTIILLVVSVFGFAQTQTENYKKITVRIQSIR